MRFSKWAAAVGLVLLLAATLTVRARPLAETEGAGQAVADATPPAASTVTFNSNAFPPTMPDR